MSTTSRQMFEGLLTELSKTNAPSMLLTDFNYFLNKAVNSYINKRYNIYDVNQQTTDDLRVLKSTAILKPTKVFETGTNTSAITTDLSAAALKNLATGQAKLFGATYEVNLPLDYLHLLNCICIYKVSKRYKCYNANDYVQFAAKRLVADSWPIVLNDFYNRPLPERPYYYIHNINTSTDLPTNPISNTQELDRTVYGTDVKDDEGLPRTISLKDITNDSLVEREAGVRYGNASNVRMEIRYGKDDSLFQLEGIMVDYIKAPQTIRLTQEQVDLTEDTSQILEFPDYVCQEIINELVHLVMENNSDQRLQNHMAVSQSIAQPVQQQAQ